MSLHIVWDGKRQCWHVTPDAPEMLRAGAIASFATLLEAENFITRQACPDEVESA